MVAVLIKIYFGIKLSEALKIVGSYVHTFYVVGYYNFE